MSFKRFALGLLVSVLLLTACAEIPGASPEEVTVTPEVPPASTPTATPITPTPDPRFTPQPLVQELEVLILESFPVQVNVHLKGILPDGCTTFEEVLVTRVDNVFTLEVKTHHSGEQACDMVARFFEEVVSLDVVGLKAGVYQVVAQGVTSSFTLAQDNMPQKPTITIPLEPNLNLAAVEGVDLLMLDSFPVQLEATVRGYFPDGCTSLDEVKTSYAKQTFTIVLTVKRPADMMCTEAIVPFEHTVPLDVLGLAKGTYTVVVNGVTQTFELTQDNVSP